MVQLGESNKPYRALALPSFKHILLMFMMGFLTGVLLLAGTVVAVAMSVDNHKPWRHIQHSLTRESYAWLAFAVLFVCECTYLLTVMMPLSSSSSWLKLSAWRSLLSDDDDDDDDEDGTGAQRRALQLFTASCTTTISAVIVSLHMFSGAQFDCYIMCGIALTGFSRFLCLVVTVWTFIYGESDPPKPSDEKHAQYQPGVV